MAPVVETLSLPQLKLGEGPHWSPRTSSLYLVDIEDSRVYRYHPDTESIYSLKIDSGTTGFVTPVAGSAEELVVGAGLSLVAVQWDGRSEQAVSRRTLQILDGEPSENRINDGKADSTGRLWFGTMSKEDPFGKKQGSFYSYSTEAGLTKYISNIGISNGMGWNEKSNRMYYIDSTRRTVDAYDYSTDGQMGGRRAIFDLQENGLQDGDFHFFPDGMTLDTDGKIWLALYRGSRVVQVDPEAGKVVTQVHLPTSLVTSVAWGGPDLSDLYVTTAIAEGDSNSGKTFRVRGTGARGHPMHEAVI